MFFLLFVHKKRLGTIHIFLSGSPVMEGGGSFLGTLMEGVAKSKHAHLPYFSPQNISSHRI